MLTQIEATMGDAAFIDGPSMGLYDVAIFPFIRQLAGVDTAQFEAMAPPQVTRWLRAMMDAPAFTTVMAKIAPWKAGDEPHLFRATLLDTR